MLRNPVDRIADAIGKLDRRLTDTAHSQGLGPAGDTAALSAVVDAGDGSMALVSLLDIDPLGGGTGPGSGSVSQEVPGGDGFNCVQVIALDADGGTFGLGYDPPGASPLETSSASALAFNATAAAVLAVLEARPSLGAGFGTVSGPAGGPWRVSFDGTKEGLAVGPLSVLAANLTKSYSGFILA